MNDIHVVGRKKMFDDLDGLSLEISRQGVANFQEDGIRRHKPASGKSLRQV